MKYYTGIGSRSTPSEYCAVMTGLAVLLEKAGFILRSGGADGADLAFEEGVSSKAKKQIFLPWKGFNKSRSLLYKPSGAAIELAASIHPNWDACDASARLLHARNCHQVLGEDLKTPSEFVVCWTPGGQPVGGTATAITLANMNKIPVFNFGDEEYFLATIKAVLQRV